MDKTEEFYNKFIKNKYSEASGASAVIDERIKINLNKYGEFTEVVDIETIHELNPLIYEVSPSFNSKHSEDNISKELYGNIHNIKFDTRLGYYQSLYAGHVLEGEYQKKASSGGIGTWIFKELFEKKLIDGVLHVKENKEENSSLLFKYDISTSLEEIQAGSKTKYYPVEFSEVLKIIKQTPGNYAIIGIPSFIMAIRLLAKSDKVINERIKFTVGLICGHQKSSKFAESLAWQVGIKPGNLKAIDFRKKLPGKPANDYGVEMTGIVNGKKVTILKPMKELLGNNWGEGFFKSIASDFTDDVMNETADITIGDAWLPEYTMDYKGNNVIVVRNTTINEIISEGIGTGKLLLDKIDKETIFRSQESHYRHTHDELAYRLYKKDKKNEWRPKKRVDASNEISFLRRKVQDLREEIAEQSHIVYKKAVELNDLNYFTEKMQVYDKKYNQLYRIINLKRLGFKGMSNKIYQKVIKIGKR